MPKIIIKVVNGKVMMDFKGFEGDTCITEADRITRNLNAKDVDVKLKDQTTQSVENSLD